MESNWRQNVWRYGLTGAWVPYRSDLGAHWQLCARVTEGPLKDYLLCNVEAGSFYVRCYKVIGDYLIDFREPLIAFTLGRHFPYGYTVEPD